MTGLTKLREFRAERTASDVLHLVFDMPDRPMNVFSNAAIAELAAFSEWLGGSDVKGVVIRSGKSAFCAGADLAELGQAYDMIMAAPAETRDRVAFDHFFPLSRALRRIETAGKPVAAAVAGLALGRGLAALSPPPGPAAPGLIAMPGSPVTLILILAAFATKYAGNVALALAQDAGARAFWSTGLAASGGLFAGLFWGRTLGLLWRALRAAGEAPTLAGLARMALSPGGRTGAAPTDG